MRINSNNYIEYAFDYANAGCFTEAIALLKLYTEGVAEVYPLAYYCISYFSAKMNDEFAAKEICTERV
jgi:hypothetical protein